MSKANPKNVENIEKSLTKQQKAAIKYWNKITNELEKTSLSVLDVFRRHKDSQNYAKYEYQFNEFQNMRNKLKRNVENAIESNNVRHMEKVIIDAATKLKNMIFLHQNEKKKLKTVMSEEYDQALMVLTKCMAELRSKIVIIDRNLSRFAVEMDLYKKLAKELNNLLNSTFHAKEEKRENIASAVINLAPEILSYIKTQ